MADVTFTIVTTICFGKDISSEIGTLEYIDSNNYKIYDLRFDEFYTRVSKDIIGNRFKIKTLFFPFLQRYDISVPYNINYKNIRTLWKGLKDYLATHTDQDSVYNRMVQNTDIDKESIFQDLFGFLFAGHETSSHAIGSALYFLYKNPEAKEKLEEELKEFKGKSHGELLTLITKEKLEEFEYLHMVVKETLRVDPPANEALPYEVVQNTTV